MRVAGLGRIGGAVLARVAGAALVVAASAGSASADAFDNIAKVIDNAGKLWGPALLVLSALLAGGAIGMGSHQSGEKVKNFLVGGVFLALAAAGGAFILSKFSGFGVGN